MKIIVTFILFCYGVFGYAQEKTDSLTLKENTPGEVTQNKNIRICAPSRAGLLQKPPLYIIKYGKKEYRNNKGSNILNQLPPDDIASINILKDTATLTKYGDDAKYGAIIITIKDEKVAAFKRSLRKHKIQR